VAAGVNLHNRITAVRLLGLNGDDLQGEIAL
jgi:hypothetical protein